MPKRRIKEFDVQAVAYLYSLNHEREDIGKILDMSLPSVSRCIKSAQKEGWLEPRPHFNKEKISPERMEEIESRVSPQSKLKEKLDRLAEKHGQTGPNIRVFSNLPKNVALDDWNARLAWFGQVSASHIRDLLLPSQVCGVSWGFTISGVVRGLRKLDSPPLRKNGHGHFIPLLGEPLGDSISSGSSTALASQLEEIMDTKTDHSLSLSGVPALIPPDIKDDELDVIERLIKKVRAYREIFLGENGHEPWIDRLDTILTGVGSAGEPLGRLQDALVRTGAIDCDKLKTLAVGDICGILFPRHPIVEEQQKYLNEIKKRWYGITWENLKKCADKGRQNRGDKNRPRGVIVAAMGTVKATSVYHGVREGLINELVIDQELSDELIKIC